MRSEGVKCQSMSSILFIFLDCYLDSVSLLKLWQQANFEYCEATGPTIRHKFECIITKVTKTNLFVTMDWSEEESSVQSLKSVGFFVFVFFLTHSSYHYSVDLQLDVDPGLADKRCIRTV